MGHDISNGGYRVLSRTAGRCRQATSRAWTRFKRERRGAIAIFVAFAVVPLIAFVGLAVDTTRGYLVKSRLNQALDAAALAGGRAFASVNRDADIQMYFKANFPDGFMNATPSPLVITPDNANKTLTVSATATMPTSFMRLVNIETVAVASSAQVAIGASNIEVALALDITQSMSGADLVSLKAAANELVDIVVQDQQTPFYTKVSIVPWSLYVNVGATDAPLIRGAITAGTPITGATRTNPLIVTAPNHGLQVDDKIFITIPSGMTQLSNDMNNTPTSGSNPLFWVVRSVTTNTFTLKKLGSSTAINSSSWSAFTSGTIYCLNPGCQYQAFQNPSNAWNVHQVSTCVTERSGANAYTDVAPSITPVGRNYPPSTCNLSQIFPLSSDKTALHNKINSLAVAGATAGQIGIAWGWYMVSPNFAYLWPNDVQKPAAYGTPQLMKVVVIMTDGDFNTAYHNGIVSQESSSGSSNDRINHNATNGNPYTQAQALCAAMKSAPSNVIVYTVGLGLSGIPAATNLLTNCASSPSHVYLPTDGTELQDAFKDIAQKINKLRLSK